MKITDIEIIPIFPPIAKRYLVVKTRDGVYQRMVYKVHTDNGLVGYGDYDGPRLSPPVSSVAPLIGRNPFDFINSNLDPGLVMALYDVMGKYLEAPAYKLMGQKLRDAVTVAAWCWGGPSAEEFRDEIVRASDQGYTIFKIHTTPLHDMIERTRAAEEVAPEGFRIHYDFTGRRGRTLGVVLPLIAELEKDHPIVGWIEDPLDRSDVDGWRTLRARTRLPIVHGGAPALGGIQEALLGMADIYMIGGEIGDTLAKGMAYGKLNIQTIMQFCGGTLAKAMALHMASVLPTATGHSINLDDQCEDDITTERIPVVEGFSPVPEGPGLGYEVDEEALARAAANRPKEIPRFVGVVHMPGGRTIYSLGQPNLVQVTGREEGDLRGHTYERWVDDGSPEFERTYQRVQNDGWYIEQERARS